jgi:hypothetical protein
MSRGIYFVEIIRHGKCNFQLFTVSVYPYAPVYTTYNKLALEKNGEIHTMEFAIAPLYPNVISMLYPEYGNCD